MIDVLLRSILTPQNIARIVNGVVVTFTGKQVFDHAVDAGSYVVEHTAAYVKSLWKRLKNWAQRYLAENATARKVYLSAVSIAAAVKKARNAGEKLVRVKVFGQHLREQSPRVIHEEEIPLDQINGVIEQAKTAPVLAMRN